MQDYKKRIVKINGYWDDYSLAHFLRSVCLRFVAFHVGYLPEPRSLIIVVELLW